MKGSQYACQTKHPKGSCTVILQLYKEHGQASVGDES